MKEHFAEMVRAARKCARLTVEKAAERLFITPRMLNYYEAGRWRVPDDMVARMVQTYGSMEVGYRWLSKKLFTGRLILPANGFPSIKKAAPVGSRDGNRKDMQLLNYPKYITSKEEMQCD